MNPLFCGTGFVSLLRAKNGTLWMGTFEGVSTLDANGSFRCFLPHPEKPDSLSASFVVDIFEDKKGRIWVATQNGLNLAKPDGSFQRFFPESHPDVPKGNGFNYILRVFEDRDGDFWLCTTGGLLHFDPVKNVYQVVSHRPGDPTSISKGSVHGIYQDRQGNLWFSTDEGISILNKKTALLNCSDWQSAQEILPSVSGSQGANDLVQTGDRYWFTSQNGLFTFTKGEPARLFLPGSFSRLMVDAQGRLLALTVQPYWFVIDPVGLKVLEKKEKENGSQRSHSLPVGLAQSAPAQDLHGTLWIGTLNCLNRCNSSTGQCRQFYDPLRNTSINDLLPDSRGNLWIATNGGISLLPAAELAKTIEDTLLHFTHFFHDPNDLRSLSSDLVLKLYEDSRGQIWAGTEVGLNLRLPDGSWQRFLKKDGLPSNKITGIIEDGEGNIWLSTANHGLSKFDWKTKRFFNLAEKDGLNTRRFFSGACLRTNDGKLVFGGYGGINCFHPKDLDFQHDSLPLLFTDFRLYGKSANIGTTGSPLQLPSYLTRQVSLPFGQKAFSVHFSALDYATPEKQVYRYKLEGFDGDWHELEPGKREVTFTNLFPRTYLLRVQSSLDGDWSHASNATMIIQVLPPWWLRWWSITLFGLLLFGAFTGVYKFRVNRKLAAAETRRLKELDFVKTRLYTNITHEFRTPLTIILGETEQVKLEIEKFGAASISQFPISQFLISKLSAIRRNGQQLLNLVNQMLDLAKLESGSLHLNLVQGDVVVFLKYLLQSFQSLADAKNISLHFSSPLDSFTMDYDTERLRQIVSNLLSNAIKFTPAGGEVTLKIGKLGNREIGGSGNFPVSQFLISVSDTGTGIPPEKLDRIFDRFYQADDSATRHAEGTGIGLTLTKELVKLLGGEISVESEPGKGSTFTVSLPVRRNAPFSQHNGEIGIENPAEGFDTPVNTPLHGEDASPVAVPGALNANGKKNKHQPSLLLVEDNPDVVRYVEGILKNDYRVLTAANGRLGLEKALETVPDLIVSDVMMPEMDGYEVCRRLKTDLRTSHIPIVMLTAKADFDSRMVGLEEGAEAYIAKPFEKRELQLVLRKLLENRELLRRYYTSGEFLGGGARPVSTQSANKSNPRDEQFLKDLLTMVESHLDDPDLSAERLAKLLHTGYANLFKKVKALTGMGVTEYVRHIRLHRAAALLKEHPETTVSLISLQVGFNNLHFFSREFKKVMGMPPKQWREEG